MAHIRLKPLAALLIALMAAFALSSVTAVAQEPDDEAADAAGQQQADDQETSDEASAEQAGNESDQRPADLDNQPLETPAGQTPGRFIPSEQISLDLGVSFPVDI